MVTRMIKGTSASALVNQINIRVSTRAVLNIRITLMKVMMVVFLQGTVFYLRILLMIVDRGGKRGNIQVVNLVVKGRDAGLILLLLVF